MNECLLPLLQRLIVLLDLLYERRKDDNALWTLISEIVHEIHSLTVAIDA